MARLQGRIVINPKVLTDNRDALAIAYNEAYRMVMEANNFEPMAEPTEEQKQFFADTAYANDQLQLKRTITARIATYDDSVPNPTPEQYQDVVNMLEMVQQAGVIQNQEEEDVVSSTLEDMTEKAGQMEQLQPMGEEAMPEGAMPEGVMPPEGAMPEGVMPLEGVMPIDGAMPEGIDPAMLQQSAVGGIDQLRTQAADKGGSVTDEEYKRLMDTMPPQPKPEEEYDRLMETMPPQPNPDDENNRLLGTMPPELEPEGPTVLADLTKTSKAVDSIERLRSYDDGQNGPDESTDGLGYRYVGDIFTGGITPTSGLLTAKKFHGYNESYGKGPKQAGNSTVDESISDEEYNALMETMPPQPNPEDDYNRLMETMPPQPNPEDDYNRLMDTMPPQPPKPLTKEEMTDQIRQRFELTKSLQMRPTLGKAIPEKPETQFDKDTRAIQELENRIAASQANADKRKEQADRLIGTLDQVADNLNKAGSTSVNAGSAGRALGKMNAQSVGARSYTDASGKRVTEYQPVDGLDVARAIRQSNNSASGRILRMADMAQKNGGVDYIVGRLNDEKTGAGVRKNIEKQLAAFDSLRESYEKGGLIQYDNDGNVISAPDGWKERIAAANMLRQALAGGAQTGPTEQSTERPTEQPTEQPTEKPTEQPTEKPTEQPTETGDETDGREPRGAADTQGTTGAPTQQMRSVYQGVIPAVAAIPAAKVVAAPLKAAVRVGAKTAAAEAAKAAEAVALTASERAAKAAAKNVGKRVANASAAQAAKRAAAATSATAARKAAEATAANAAKTVARIGKGANVAGVAASAAELGIAGAGATRDEYTNAINTVDKNIGTMHRYMGNMRDKLIESGASDLVEIDGETQEMRIKEGMDSKLTDEQKEYISMYNSILEERNNMQRSLDTLEARESRNSGFQGVLDALNPKDVWTKFNKNTFVKNVRRFTFGE